MKEEYLRLLNQYYDHIYVISVADAENRRDMFRERFMGLDYTFFFGADKNNFSIEELTEKNIFDEELARKHHRYHKTMKPGEIACSWSHRMVYEDMIRKGYQRILVFEDDAVPDETRLKDIADILAEIPAGCELLWLGWNKNGETPAISILKKPWYHFQHRLRKLKWNHLMIRNIYAKPYSSHLKKAGYHDYTYAYAISRSGAEKLINMQTPIQFIADNLLAHAATKEILESYIVWPKLFLHDNLPDGTHRDSYIR
jgi:glycosyl transferase family 25